jgi:hypothetical protein
MKKAILGLALLVLSATTAQAYEYKLQYGVPAVYNTYGKVAGYLRVVGDTYNADGTISGVISFDSRSCGTRYCGAATFYCATATWDAQGNLVGSTSPVVAPFVSLNSYQLNTACESNPVLAVNGSEYVYTDNGSSFAGFDAKWVNLGGGGFISTPASHYTWTIAPTNFTGGAYESNTGYIVTPDNPITFDITVTSDGDLPLNITSTVSQVVSSGYYTNGTGTVMSVTGSCLRGPINPGTTCTLTVAFDPTTIVSTGSPYCYAYNNLTLALASDAGNLADWFTHFTITGVRGCGVDN